MRSENRKARATARALGWFSIGLGLAEVLCTRRLARAVGLVGHEASLRACGLREIVTGAALLVADRPVPFVWARVAGDAVDLGLLGTRAASGERGSGNAAIALLAVAGVTAIDLACAKSLAADASAAQARQQEYAQRSGFPKPPSQMQGAALADFEAPADMRTPSALRPYDAD
jgi:hypothetical protein